MKEKVQAALDKIRPMLQADGGDVELVDIRSTESSRSVSGGPARGVP